MNKNSIKIEHLFNPAKFGVGQMYVDPIEGMEIQEKFEQDNINLTTYIQKCGLLDALYVILRAYKDKYPSTHIADTYHDFNTKHISDIELRQDLKIEWKDTYGVNTIDTVIIKFRQPQNITALKNTIAEVLSSNEFSETNNTYTILNSPINTIEVSPERIQINIHRNKVIQY